MGPIFKDAPIAPKKETATIFQFRVLRNGDEDADVTILQQKLQELEFFPKRRPTGFFGPVTESALRKFQKQSGLPETGILDLATYQRLHTTNSQTLSGVSFGNRSETIRQAQLLLAQLKFFPPDVHPNGFFGPITQDSLKSFQRFYGISQSGAFDSSTVSFINNLLPLLKL